MAKLKMTTPKQITINYLRDIQKDLKNAIKYRPNNSDSYTHLEGELKTIVESIKIVEESEGE